VKTKPTWQVAFAGVLVIGILVAVLVIARAQLVGSDPTATPAVASPSMPAEVWTNSIGMKFIRLEPGSFTMGYDHGDWDEKPIHILS
jgi:formylglycine-generating enzyme required for sulfatase activity